MPLNENKIVIDTSSSSSTSTSDESDSSSAEGSIPSSPVQSSTSTNKKRKTSSVASTVSSSSSPTPTQEPKKKMRPSLVFEPYQPKPKNKFEDRDQSTYTSLPSSITGIPPGLIRFPLADLEPNDNMMVYFTKPNYYGGPPIGSYVYITEHDGKKQIKYTQQGTPRDITDSYKFYVRQPFHIQMEQDESNNFCNLRHHDEILSLDNLSKGDKITVTRKSFDNKYTREIKYYKIKGFPNAYSLKVNCSSKKYERDHDWVIPLYDARKMIRLYKFNWKKFNDSVN